MSKCTQCGHNNKPQDLEAQVRCEGCGRRYNRFTGELLPTPPARGQSPAAQPPQDGAGPEDSVNRFIYVVLGAVSGAGFVIVVYLTWLFIRVKVKFDTSLYWHTPLRFAWDTLSSLNAHDFKVMGHWMIFGAVAGGIFAFFACAAIRRSS